MGNIQIILFSEMLILWVILRSYPKIGNDCKVNEDTVSLYFFAIEISFTLASDFKRIFDRIILWKSIANVV